MDNPSKVKRERRPKRPDLKSALKAVVQAGVAVHRIETDRDGKIIIFAGKPEQAPDTGARDASAVANERIAAMARGAA